MGIEAHTGRGDRLHGHRILAGQHEVPSHETCLTVELRMGAVPLKTGDGIHDHIVGRMIREEIDHGMGQFVMVEIAERLTSTGRVHPS